MASESLLRRAAKHLFSRALPERLYVCLQSVTMAWDIRRGTLSEPEVSLLPLAVRHGDTAIDIGANYGLYTHHLSKAVGDHGRVYAFEPIPFTNDALRMVARLLKFKNVEILRKGCSDKSARLAFTVPVQASGAITAGLAHLRASAEHDGDASDLHRSDCREVVCDVVALDEFLPPLTDLSFIKCDIEGAELLAFRGCEATISLHRPTVLSEVDRAYLPRFGVELEDLVAFFLDKGYHLYTYDGASRRLTETVPGAIVDGNVLFVHPDRHHRFAGLPES